MGRGQALLVLRRCWKGSGEPGLQVEGGLEFSAGLFGAAESMPKRCHAKVPFSANRLAALVFSDAGRKRLPAFQRPFEIALLVRAQLWLGADQLLDGLVGAGPVVG